MKTTSTKKKLAAKILSKMLKTDMNKEQQQTEREENYQKNKDPAKNKKSS